jgi:hypothetical protein
LSRERERERERERDMAENARKLIAATFETPDGGSRAAGAIGGSMSDKIGNTAVLYVKPDGKAKFVESKDWGAGRGALLGGAIGIIGGPVGIVAGGAIGALTSKLRDSGFKNDQLEQLRGRGRAGSAAAGAAERPRRSSSRTSTRALPRFSTTSRSRLPNPSPPRPRPATAVCVF